MKFTVYLDTSVFKAQNFSFRGDALKALVDWAQTGKVRVLMPEVTRREVVKKIDDAIDEAEKGILGLQKKAMILRNSETPLAQGLFDEFVSLDYRREQIGLFEAFLQDVDCRVIDVDDDDGRRVLDLYFDGQAPFGAGRKKHEFPDAFIIVSLLRWAKENGEVVLVASTDRDLEFAAKQTDALRHVGNLDELRSVISDELDLLAGRARETYDEHAPKIRDQIIYSLGRVPVNLRLPGAEDLVDVTLKRLLFKETLLHAMQESTGAVRGDFTLKGKLEIAVDVAPSSEPDLEYTGADLLTPGRHTLVRDFDATVSITFPRDTKSPARSSDSIVRIMTGITEPRQVEVELEDLASATNLYEASHSYPETIIVNRKVIERGRRRLALADLPAQAEPTTPLDGRVFLDAAKPVLKALDDDLLARAKASPAMTAALKARHAAEKKAERTADGFAQWQTHFVGQVGAAWLLSCVFVRTLEDRGLLDRARIAGPGAADAQKLFFAMAPSLTERDYLLTVFRELSRYPAAEALFDARHNPIWLLTPSAHAAKKLLALFRTPTPDAPAFRFGQPDTRFLGDLYQDLDEGVRKRYALLQTPDFIESFILDRTLEPAIEKFGLDDTDLIDPTCGSGHFVLGAFDRLYEHRRRTHPGESEKEAATAALDKVYGADINPYAAAIARFRLTLAFLEKAGFDRLRDAPRLPLHVAVADSLLYNPQHAQGELHHQPGVDVRDWDALDFEDPEEARAILHRQYAAVVGNPPYITVKDKILRDRYRAMYESAFRSYSLAVPFCERFFQLGRAGGRIGQITANSFMKREFGVKLIKEFLPTVDLDLIINTSGAFIPGHGTPTVLLFGANRSPSAGTIRVVLAKRGEPSTPKVAAEGQVWSAIRANWQTVGYQDDFISVDAIERSRLAKHPWSLAGGGAGALKLLLEDRATQLLADVVETPIGRAARTGHDEVYFYPPHIARRLGIHDDWWMELAIGEAVRDWSLGGLDKMLFPYDRNNHLDPFDESDSRSNQALRHLWRFRTALRDRATFQGKMEDAGKKWFEYMQYTKSANETPLSITFAFVATHNHFVLDRGGKVYNRSAPIIKLPETATEEDHLALLAYLNSSTALFWMRQVFSPKGMNNASRSNSTPFLVRFEFDGTKLAQMPLPPKWDELKPIYAHLGRVADDAATKREAASFVASTDLYDDVELGVEMMQKERERLLRRLIAVQEEIDWLTYGAFGLVEGAGYNAESRTSELRLGGRPFELAFDAEDATAVDWFRWHETEQSSLEAEAKNYPEHFLRHRIELSGTESLRLLESPQCKRRFIQPSGKAAQSLETDRKTLNDQYMLWLDDQVEAKVSAQGRPVSAREAEELAMADEQLADAFEFHGPPQGGRPAQIRMMLDEEAIPFSGALTYSTPGFEKHAQWQHTWDLQRREDNGEDVGPIPVPPKYTSKDYRSPTYWRLRGKLDVPKERFISYPGCESDEDPQPIYGWAGWDHEQRAKALATLYWDRKTQEGWSTPRLTPMLAGLLELQFWLDLWHAEDSDEYGGASPADYYRGFLDTQCSELGLTHDDLRAWRP